MQVVDLAEILHETLRELTNKLGYLDRLRWKYCPDFYKAGILRSIGEMLDDPDTTPEALHESWLQWMQRDGWQHGAILYVKRKIHPDLVPYDQLSIASKAKIGLVRDITRQIAPLLGGNAAQAGPAGMDLDAL